MAQLLDELIQKLENLPQVTVGLWKDSDLLCVFFRGKEIAHFQGSHEIDIRLSPRIIKHEGLLPPKATLSHPDRPQSSRWIVQSFANREEADKIVRLVQLASTLLSTTK